MTRSFVPFRSWHYSWLTERGLAVDQIGGLTMSPALLAYLEGQNTWTFAVDGAPVAVAGTMQQWARRHIAWAHMSLLTGPHMLWITQETRQNLAMVEGRIESTVRSDFVAGHRWMKLLDFEVETKCLKAYGPEGEDHVGYRRIN